MSPDSAAPDPAVRPIREDDLHAMRRFVDRLSVATRHWRFHAPFRCAETVLPDLMEVDAPRHVALVATAGTEIVGEARYARSLDDDDAEFAICVADAHRSRGIGSALLAVLTRAAAGAGLASVYGDVLYGNSRMESFLRRHGFRSGGVDRMASGIGLTRWRRAVFA